MVSQDCGTEQRDDVGGVLDHLPVADADHLVAEKAQLEVAGAVVLERLAPAVEAIAVGLDDEPTVTPEEVDEVGTDGR